MKVQDRSQHCYTSEETSVRTMDNSPMSFDFLQLMDSAFPIGSFAHSGGLEALCGLTDTGFRRKRDSCIKSTESSVRFEELVMCILENSGFLQVPFLRDSLVTGGDILLIQNLDRNLHVLLSNHVAKRASLQQGRSLAGVASSTFSRHPKAESFRCLSEAIGSGKLIGHFAVVFGCVCAIFELDAETAAGCFLFGQLRTIMGSAVRMGLFGPLKAQELQNGLQSRLPELVEKSLVVTQPHICHPVLEVAQSAHDKMFAKLFYS